MTGEAHTHPRSHPPVLESTPVVVNDRVAEGIGLLVLDAPLVATHVQPGQFVHLRVAEGTDFILRRPFSVHRVVGGRIEILYQVLGRGTRQMSELEQGDVIDVVGPLGNGWTLPDDASHALLVAGGLGAAPLGMWAERLAERGVAVSVAQGAPYSERLVARELFERVARRVEIATDDGSAGERGFVTGPAERLIRSGEVEVVFACGPERMQQAVANLAAAAGIPCQVSLERLMACGIGACLSCVVSTTEGLKRACVDGPVFDASTIKWESSEVPPKH
ncbi:MAG: dihydroorotate dehydrogenase electron transfer subunit [Coriobacteriales bacterium]|nr:dihydroorotate dehydrogenase electron transfer subunit [Coriobacteriales bacterium]